MVRRKEKNESRLVLPGAKTPSNRQRFVLIEQDLDRHEQRLTQLAQLAVNAMGRAHGTTDYASAIEAALVAKGVLEDGEVLRLHKERVEAAEAGEVVRVKEIELPEEPEPPEPPGMG